jgi:hypothetical protein
MTNDIVARLRSYAKDQGGWHNIDETCEEAADEIERLRAALKEAVYHLDFACQYREADEMRVVLGEEKLYG